MGACPSTGCCCLPVGYARDGYPITQRVARDFASQVNSLDSDARGVFTRDGGPIPLGARHAQPALAATLERIGREGRSGFYEGPVAEEIIAKLRGIGGRHTGSDFAAAVGDYVDPISTEFRDRRVWQCPPNGQGVIALMLLNMMRGIDSFGDHPLNVERMHHEIESGRLAYRDRGLVLADPAQSSVPVAAMLDDAYAEALRGRIRPDRRLDPLPESGFRGIPAPYTSLSLIVTATPAASSIRFMTISAPGSWRRKAACCFTIAVRASLSIRTIRTAWRQARGRFTR